MSMVRSLVMLFMLMVSMVAVADTRQQLPVAQCIDLVSRQFQVDPLPIHLLREVEGGWEGAVRQNANGSEDLGPMQVNSIHLPEFAALGITREEIRDNTGCRNVFVAISLYLRHLQAANGNVAMAIARYHSKSAAHASVYLGRIARIIERRLQRERLLVGR
ncbi:hypothetical protein C7S18_20105 [Ahniella affigens]|uniref:Transglycosylase SLT domain-containing protein n=2 Tax=Ahniella affigens TaxID=2021234 RepID=A0A2P1PWV0_9GAMM|nr:hypothetical protein C7S18_20105 [Ahniella affigens]